MLLNWVTFNILLCESLVFSSKRGSKNKMIMDIQFKKILS